MAFRAEMTQAAAASRHRNMAPFVVLVFAAAAVSAAFAGLWLVDVVRLPFHSDSGIAGWVTQQKYAKAQETFNLAVAVVGLPVAMLAAWWTWIAGAAWGSRFARCAPSRLLKQMAAASVGMLTLAPSLPQVKITSLLPLFLALAGVTLTWFLLLVLNRRLGGRSANLAIETEPTPAPARIPSRRWLRVLRLALVWCLLPLLVYVLSFDNRLDSGIDAFNQFHEGERLYPMWVMQHGGVPYRDAYLQHGFFRDALVPHLGATLFGPTLEGLRRIDDILWPLGVLSVYLAGAALFGANPLSALFLALFLLSTHIEIPERVFFAMLAVAAMAAAVRRPGFFERTRQARTRLQGLARFLRQGWLLILSGALASLAFWTSVEMGLFAWAGLGTFLIAAAVLGPGRGLWARTRPMVAFGAGVLAGLCLVGVYFAWHGAVRDVLRNVYQQCAYQTETWGIAFPSLSEITAPRDQGGRIDWGPFLQTDSVRMVLPFVCLILAEAWLVWLWIDRRLWTSPRGWRLLLVTCVGLFFARGLLGRSDLYHLYDGLVSQLLIAALALDAGLSLVLNRMTALPANLRRRRFWPLASGLGVLVLLAFAGRLFAETYEPWASLKQRAHTAREDLGMILAKSFPAREPFAGAGRITVSDAEADHARILSGFIRENTQPGEAIFNFSSYAMPMFFANRPSAARYFIPCYATTPAMQREAIAEIENRKPRLAYRGVDHDFDGLLNGDRQPLMQDYLLANYEPLGRDEEIEFLWRKGAEPRPVPRDLQLTVDAQRDYQIESVSARKCVQFADAPSVEGGDAQIRPCDKSDAQRFQFEPRSNNRYRIRLAGSKKCLDVEASSRNDGTAVKGFWCHENANQEWRIVGGDEGTVRLVAQHSGKVLDVWYKATADGSPLKQVHWRGGSNQQFRLVEREPRPKPAQPALEK
jgi:hypothetical protein